MITSLSLYNGGLGRAGNQFFTIAGTIGVAIRSGQQYAFPEWVNRDNALFGGQEDKMSDYFVNELPLLPPGINFQDYPYFWGYQDIHLPNGNWNLFNHFQSFKFFEHCRETILHYFTMKDEPEQNDYVAIHWRAGDYQEGENAYHPRQPFEYYEKAMALFPDSEFILFTDDIPAAAVLFAPLMQKYKILYSDTGNYIEDFKLMKRCKSFIIANSSFSAMAAWLGTHEEKKVVAPSLWFGKAAGISAKHIYHETWDVI